MAFRRTGPEYQSLSDIKAELTGKLVFDQDSVLFRLGTSIVSEAVVKTCLDALKSADISKHWQLLNNIVQDAEDDTDWEFNSESYKNAMNPSLVRAMPTQFFWNALLISPHRIRFLISLQVKMEATTVEPSVLPTVTTSRPKFMPWTFPYTHQTSLFWIRKHLKLLPSTFFSPQGTYHGGDIGKRSCKSNHRRNKDPLLPTETRSSKSFEELPILLVCIWPPDPFSCLLSVF